ncbi:MAG: cobalamin biosynthesis protein CobW [Actinomyces ruminicola]|uniref:GTPase, G3E family n=1 Tax=Actinomyces ruminicola TaxID=332524 RepID=A0A1H0FGN8_9ACTO|nr:GTP-binding protein [Actinomyces ruminicola]MBE6480792.1 cobalamin biosynthesis protein CobW [Actinomyces ruminicola]SDN93827.1 GTPase, G3E family [Actinomyces ruminicola]
MHCLTIISAVDPVLLDLTALALHGERALVLRATLLPDQGERGVIRLAAESTLDSGSDATFGRSSVIDIPRPTECWTCSLREVLVAVAEDRVRLDSDGATVILLPVGVELVHLVPGLAEELASVPGATLAGVAHVINADSAAVDLLEHRPLSALAGEAYAGDGRCAGEIHMVAVGYADVVIALGEDPVGRDLVEHLRPHDTLLLPGLDAELLPELLSVRHDADSALARVHPATTRAWGGPDDHGVRTLDLSSELPFHPVRLREFVADLAGNGLLARGCFWLPSRPGRVCTWEVAGGVVSVGDAGSWDAAPRMLVGELAQSAVGRSGRAPDAPHCHLVVTGVADEAQCARVADAFHRILLRPDELPDALAWVGAPDGLEDWFGRE